jgi:hypothetical protein
LILKVAGAPQAPDFSLLAQRKVSKRKGILLTRPDGCSALLAAHGAKRTRRCAPQTPFRFIRARL